jgi:hypothetical protein
MPRELWFVILATPYGRDIVLPDIDIGEDSYDSS